MCSISNNFFLFIYIYVYIYVYVPQKKEKSRKRRVQSEAQKTDIVPSRVYILSGKVGTIFFLLFHG